MDDGSGREGNTKGGFGSAALEDVATVEGDASSIVGGMVVVFDISRD